jgi:tetratricopeptide (TPR) repeat protein
MATLNLRPLFGVLLLGATLPGLLCLAQSVSVDVNSPEGKQMTLIERETDAARKQAMLEEFVHTYGAKPISAWAYTQLQGLYLQQQQYDKALEAGAQTLVLDPNSLEAAYGGLKSAEAKSDAALIAKWAGETGRIAQGIAAAPPGGDKARADYAKQVETYSEYAIYAAVLKASDPGQIIMLVESLEQRSPQSSYLSQSYGRYLNALRQSGQQEKAAQAAERQIARDPANEEALLVAAGFYMQQNQNAKAIDYAGKLVALINGKQKPAEISDADWQKKRNSTLGLAYWIEGVSAANSKEYSKADQSLRSALPLIRDNPEVLAIGLFHLGVVDYQLGKTKRSRALLQDALKYSQQSAALKSPLQQQAQGNVAAIRRQLGSATAARAR